jgi:hypothetical protein
MTIPAFGWVKKPYRLLARSRTAFAQVPVGSPFRAAASSYAFLRRLERRISSLWSSGSSMGGLPGPRLAVWVTGLIIARTNILTQEKTGYILSVQ